jgi:hypothetical protein
MPTPPGVGRTREEMLMAVVMTNVIPGGNAEMYEAVSGKTLPGGKLPDGCQVHIAGPEDEGWRVITVWDSREAFDRFREDKLVPTLREVRGDEFVAPEIKAAPVHRLITS